MRLRILALLLACLTGSGCAAAERERTAPAVVKADLPIERLRELVAQRRYYEGFLIWPRVEKALAGSAGRGTLGREYAALIAGAAEAKNPDEWRWIMASPDIQRRLKVDLVVEIGAHE